MLPTLSQIDMTFIPAGKVYDYNLIVGRSPLYGPADYSPSPYGWAYVELDIASLNGVFAHMEAAVRFGGIAYLMTQDGHLMASSHGAYL